MTKRIDPYLLLLVLFSVFAIGPLLGPGYFWGAHDGRHSVYFLFEFDRVIQDGIYYPRWLPDFTFGYGYPFFNIYAPGPFYVGEALLRAGLDFVTATKVIFAFAILLSGPAMFGFVKRLTSSSQAAFLSGLAYVYIPYHIADVYVRGDLAESVAMVFLPLTLWGFYEVTRKPGRMSIVMAALAYAAMAFSHDGAVLFFTPVLALWVLFLMVRHARSNGIGLRDRRLVPAFLRIGVAPLGAVLLGMGLAAIFLLPAALEMQYVRGDQWFSNYYSYTNHFVDFFQLFSPFWGFGISVPGPHDGMPFQLGAVPLLLALFAVAAIVQGKDGTRGYWLFFGGMTLVIVFLMLSVSLPIWGALHLVSVAQFPWRLLTLTTVSLAVLAGAVVTLEKREAEQRPFSPAPLLLGVLVIAGAFPYINAPMQLQAKEGPVGVQGLFRFQQSAGEMTGSTAWVKEIPTWSDMADVIFAGKKVKTKAITTDYGQDLLWIGLLPGGLRTSSEQFVFHANAPDLKITFNTFYYPGWHAYLTKPKSTEVIRELQITAVGEQGKIQVEVPEGREQWLLLRFEDTWPRTAGEWISAASLLIVLGLLLWQIRAQRKSGAPTSA